MARPRTKDRESIRSERVSLALTPATYDGLIALAQCKACTVNDLLVGILDRLIEQNATVIADFKAAQDKAAAAVNLSVDAAQD